MCSLGWMVVFQAKRQGAEPPSATSSSNQSETSTGSEPVFHSSINWSDDEPMSPSLFQSVPLYCSDDADTRISLIRMSALWALTSLMVAEPAGSTVLVL